MLQSRGPLCSQYHFHQDSVSSLRQVNSGVGHTPADVRPLCQRHQFVTSSRVLTEPIICLRPTQPPQLYPGDCTACCSQKSRDHMAVQTLRFLRVFLHHLYMTGVTNCVCERVRFCSGQPPWGRTVKSNEIYFFNIFIGCLFWNTGQIGRFSEPNLIRGPPVDDYW